MILLFGIFLTLMLIGMPIGFALFSSSIIFIIANGMPLVMVSQKLISGVSSFPLIAISFFILAGTIMNSAGITKRIFNFSNSIVGHWRGGLAYVNIMNSVIFAGMSGSAIADAGGIGSIETQAMIDAGFDDDFSVAVTGASSIIGPIIPPSVPMVIFAVTSGVSTGRLFAGGFIPGLLLAIAMGIVVYVYSKKRNMKKAKRSTLKEIWKSFAYGFFALLTPVILIGGMMSGVFTPTEASIVAVFYALILGFLYGEIKLKDIPGLLRSTLKTTTGILFILGAASLFSWLLTITQTPQKMALAFAATFTNKYVAMFMLNIFFLLLGCLMDSDPIMIILVPILMPLIKVYGIDPVHFGVIMTVNLMIGLLTPPVGLVLYTLNSTSGVSIPRISKAIFPFLVVLFLMNLIFTYVPVIVTFLPNLIYG